MQILDQRFAVEFWLRLRSASDNGYGFRKMISEVFLIPNSRYLGRKALHPKKISEKNHELCLHLLLGFQPAVKS